MQFHCLTQLWDELVSKFIIPKVTVRPLPLPLPDDIIVEILSRLPAHQVLKCRRVCRNWRALTSTAYFAEKHVGRAIPIVLVQYHSSSILSGNQLKLFFLEEGAKKRTMMKKIYNEPVGETILTMPIFPVLNVCCNGLLLINSYFLTSNFYVCNPFTGEKLTLRKRFSGAYICGMFFHSLTREYRVLSASCRSTNCYAYEICRLGGDLWRQVGTFTYHPEPHLAAIIMNGALHWMVMDDYNNQFDIAPCANSIMMFNMDTEELKAMPHPGIECSIPTRGRHRRMHLLEMEGQLCLCDLHHLVLDIWILEDYPNWGWVKRCNISLKWDLKLYPFISPGSVNYEIKPMNIGGGELLLIWSYRGIFQYNLLQNTVRKVNSKRVNKWGEIADYDLFFTTYTKSLVSLRDLTIEKKLK